MSHRRMNQPLRMVLSLALLCCTSFTAFAQETTLSIAIVDNRDLVRMQELSGAFTEANPDIALDWITLDENVLRQRVTTDISTGGGQFDVVLIGTYEVPVWEQRGWLQPLNDMPESYATQDILPAIRKALSVDGILYAAPFYGESSFTMYRKDLFDKAGLEMPREPTWDFIRQAAAKITDRNSDISGICLRGEAGWGENMAFITAMANSYGARWFDADWQPQLDSIAWASAVNDYVTLLKNYGPQNAASNGYKENLALFQNGNCGIWIDATVAASSVSDPRQSTVAGRVGFALAPDRALGKRSNWLWSWAFAIPESSHKKDAAKRFVAWATSREYTELVAAQDGWANVPPGTRSSLYKNPAYLKVAPFAEMTLASIESADPDHPTVEDVPYTGIQYVAIPEFPGMATAVGARISKALAGEISTEEALKNAQWVAEKVIERALFIEEK